MTEWVHAAVNQPGVALWAALGQSLLVSAYAVGAGTSRRLLAERTGHSRSSADQLSREQDAAARAPLPMNGCGSPASCTTSSPTTCR